MHNNFVDIRRQEEDVSRFQVCQIVRPPVITANNAWDVPEWTTLHSSCRYSRLFKTSLVRRKMNLRGSRGSAS